MGLVLSQNAGRNRVPRPALGNKGVEPGGSVTGAGRIEAENLPRNHIEKVSRTNALRAFGGGDQIERNICIGFACVGYQAHGMIWRIIEGVIAWIGRFPREKHDDLFKVSARKRIAVRCPEGKDG